MRPIPARVAGGAIVPRRPLTLPDGLEVRVQLLPASPADWTACWRAEREDLLGELTAMLESNPFLQAVPARPKVKW